MLDNCKKLFLYYKTLGEKAIDQLEESQLFYQANEDCNSIAMIIQHLAGNMLSRWTDILTSDGEKSWRNRDSEFEPVLLSKTAVMDHWKRGWSCLFDAMDTLSDADMQTIIYIRQEGHTVMEAVLRQLAHYPYHIGQIVHLAKELKQSPWETLSIARNASREYNEEKFSRDKKTSNFVQEELDRLNKKLLH